MILGAEKSDEISRLCKNERVALISNDRSRVKDMRSSFHALKNSVQIKRILSPEHGYHGDHQAGIPSEDSFDSDLKVHIFSLYKESGKEEHSSSGDLDKKMRSEDTQDAGKFPSNEAIEGIDAILFDLQDVGTRVYTYISTMLYSMKASILYGKRFVVLDRPNPITGIIREGPVLEYPKYSSFIGPGPIPLRHGLTVGELALFFNEKLLSGKCNLNVVRMDGWKRNTWYDETGLPWVSPSPNIPTISTATAYPGAVMLEGTNVAEGRGTTNPFLTLGAPWVDGFKASSFLNELKIPGVKTIPVRFRPTFSKYSGQLCMGVEVFVLDRKDFRAFKFYTAVIQYLHDEYPDFSFYGDYFDRVCGGRMIRDKMFNGDSLVEIMESVGQGISLFNDEIRDYELYK